MYRRRARRCDDLAGTARASRATFDGESLGRPGPIGNDGPAAHRDDDAGESTSRGSSEAQAAGEHRPRAEVAGSIPAPGPWERQAWRASLSDRQRRLLDEWGGESGTAVLDRPADHDETGFGDWYALRLEEPERCRGCGYSSPFYWDNLPVGGGRSAHVVVVWPTEDDPALLRLMARQPGEPVPYEASYGDAESWYKVNPS